MVKTREVLVIHPGALGDVLQAVPALVALRSPGGTRLVFAGQMRIGRLLSGTGVVDEALSFDGLGLEALFGDELPSAAVRSRLARFDRAVSWFGARAERFPERLRVTIADAILAPPVPGPGWARPVWEHLVATLAPWGVGRPARPGPLALPETWRAEARRALAGLGVDARRPLLVVHPGAGGEGKRWLAGGFARVVEQAVADVPCEVLVHRGPADAPAVEELARSLRVPARVVSEPSLDVLAAILAGAAAYLGGDSGVSHLAAAVGAPAVILFAPGTRTRWAPWSPATLPLATPADEREAAEVARALAERLAGRRRYTTSTAR